MPEEQLDAQQVWNKFQPVTDYSPLQSEATFIVCTEAQCQSLLTPHLSPVLGKLLEKNTSELNQLIPE